MGKNSENGVSEVVGAMLMLLIFVVFLGTMQVYQVPSWNKELEKQEFDKAYSDFIDMRSDLEDASLKNIPRTSSISMGARYPQRIVFRNPGPGAYGTITTYPLNVTLNYNLNGTYYSMNYSSTGVVYEIRGISNFPKLVYENGMIIRDFGNYNDTDDVNRLTTNGNLFIPILTGVKPISSIEKESLNFFPAPLYADRIFSSLNVTIETRYPEVWARLSYNSRPSGSSVNITNRTIKISDVYGFNVRALDLPDISSLSQDKIYSGMITLTDPNTSTTMDESNSCGYPGKYMIGDKHGCVDLIASSSNPQFIIRDIAMVKSSTNAELRFYVRDKQDREFDVSLIFNSDSNGNITSVSVSQYSPSGSCSAAIDYASRLVDLTSCYRNANIVTPNVLKITVKDWDILYANFLIN